METTDVIHSLTISSGFFNATNSLKKEQVGKN